MKKHLKKFLWLSPFLLLALYWLGVYLSLKNPMEEINYSENSGWMRYVMFKPFTETIGSDRIWKEDEGFQMYPYCLLYTSPSPRDRTRSRMPSSA